MKVIFTHRLMGKVHKNRMQPGKIVADVISIDNKLQLSEGRKKEILKKRKVLAVQKVLQCTRCALKCEKCGTQISEAQLRRATAESRPKQPYRFCEGCLDEYLDYIERLKGRGDEQCYWHNDIWLEGWRLWIDYQGTVDRYLKSKEFKQLVKELQSMES